MGLQTTSRCFSATSTLHSFKEDKMEDRKNIYTTQRCLKEGRDTFLMFIIYSFLFYLCLIFLSKRTQGVFYRPAWKRYHTLPASKVQSFVHSKIAISLVHTWIILWTREIWFDFHLHLTNKNLSPLPLSHSSTGASMPLCLVTARLHFREGCT